MQQNRKKSERICHVVIQGRFFRFRSKLLYNPMSQAHTLCVGFFMKIQEENSFEGEKENIYLWCCDRACRAVGAAIAMAIVLQSSVSRRLHVCGRDVPGYGMRRILSGR